MEDNGFEKAPSRIPTQKEVYMEMNRDQLNDVAEALEWKIKDYEGDPWWKYEVEYYYCGDLVWTDHWHIKPDATQIYNAALSSLKDGSFGDQMMERFWERDERQVKKYKAKDEKGRPRKIKG